MVFTRRRLELQRRRESLVVRSAELRLVVAGQATVLRGPLALADSVRAATNWLRGHPEWVAGAVLVTALLRPRRTLRWAARLWWGYGLLQRAQRLTQRWAEPQR